MNSGDAGLIPTREYRSSIDRVIGRLGLKKPSPPAHKHIWTIHGIKTVPVKAPPPRRDSRARSNCQQLPWKRDPSIEFDDIPTNRSSVERREGRLFPVHGVKGARVSRNSRALEVLRRKMDASISGEKEWRTASVPAVKGDFKLMSSTNVGSSMPSYTWPEGYEEDQLPDGKSEKVLNEASDEPVSMPCFGWLHSKHKKRHHKPILKQEPSLFGRLLQIGSRRSLRRTQTYVGPPPGPPSPPSPPSSTEKSSKASEQTVKCGRKSHRSDPGPKSNVRHIRHHHSDSAKDFYRYRCNRCGSFDFLGEKEKEFATCLESWRATDGNFINRSNPCVGTSTAVINYSAG